MEDTGLSWGSQELPCPFQPDERATKCAIDSSARKVWDQGHGNQARIHKSDSVIRNKSKSYLEGLAALMVI